MRVPKFSTPENQTVAQRCSELREQVPFEFDDETILIGHSLGAAYLLHILQNDRNEKIRQAVFVSGLVGEINIPEFDELNADFIKNGFDWKKIKNSVEKVNIFHGSDDPFVPLSHAEKLQKELGGELKIIENGGHLNSKTGFGEFGELFELLEV